MKVLYSFIFFVLICTVEVAAQDIIGIKAFGSLTSASVNSQSAPPDGPRLGYGGEVFYQHRFTRSFFGSVGLNYNQRGYYEKVNLRDAFNQNLGTTKFHSNLDYISLPIGVGLRTGGSVTFFGRIAFNPSLCVKSSVHEDGTSAIQKATYHLADTKTFDFGALAEAGVGFPIGTNRLTISFTWLQSFGSNSSAASIVNYGGWLGVGYEVKIGK